MKDNLINASALVGEPWQTDTASAFLGYGFRNAAKTEATAYPVVFTGLGGTIGSELAYFDRVGADQGAPVWSSAYSIPGFCVLKFDPLIAPTRDGTKTVTNYIFERLWSKSRLYNNDVDNMQPVDLSAISVGTALLKMYVALFFKILAVIKVKEDDINLYKVASDMLSALGFHHSAQDIRANRVKWTDRFNDDIIGAINDSQWLSATFPGADHWAALILKWYKDCNTDTDYCQTYTFTLEHFWALRYQQGDQTVHYWNIVREPMPETIDGFLDKVQTLIRALFYDSSARAVQAVLESINARTGGDNQLDIRPVDLSFLSYDFDADSLVFEYNRDMLLAIHNATVCQGVTVGDAEQDPSQGTWKQTINITRNSEGDIATRFTKMVNLPWFNAAKSDLINATMWTVVRHKEAAWADDVFDADICGSEIITDATMYRFVPDVSDRRGYSLAFTKLHSVESADADGKYKQGVLDTVSQASGFNCAPLIYVVSGRDAEHSTPGSITGVFGQLEAVYRCDHATLASMKQQYLRNFWGYPFDLKPEEVGTFQTTGETPSAAAVSRDPIQQLGDEKPPTYSKPGHRGGRGGLRGKSKNKNANKSNGGAEKSDSEIS